MAVDLKMVRSNLPPRTIMRGPGFLNAVMIIERCVQQSAASALNSAPSVGRRTCRAACTTHITAGYSLAALVS